MLCCAWLLSCVWLFETPWTVAHQPPLSMGILQAGILEWVAMPFSAGSSQPRNQTCSPTLQADSLLFEPSGKPKNTGVGSVSFSRRSSPPRNQTRFSCVARGFFTTWTTRDPAVPLLLIYIWKNENSDSKRYMHCSVHSHSIYNRRGAWWAAVYAVAQSRTWLTRLSSSRDTMK